MKKRKLTRSLADIKGGLRAAVRKTRPGIGLPTALMIVVICSLLASVMFGMSSNFSMQAELQQETYLTHARAASYIERVKGMISDENRVRADQERMVLHRRGYREGGEDPEDILTVDDIEIKGLSSATSTELSDLNGQIPGSSQYVRVRVFDVGYMLDNLDTSFLENGMLKKNLNSNQLATIKDMPPPLLLPVIVSDDFRMTDDSELDDGRDRREDPTPAVAEMDLDKIGIYVIRVEVFDKPENHPDRRRLRFAEEAFFQVGVVK